MKKNILMLITSALLISGAAQAEDSSATISISGELKPPEYNCLVMLSESSVSILEKSDTLIMQGSDATAPTLIHVTIKGDEQCGALVNDGKIAYRFQGTPDNADGTALANALTDATAAKGVAIGIFDENNQPLSVNDERLVAKPDTVFGLQMVQLTNQEAVAGNINSTLTVQIERL